MHRDSQQDDQIAINTLRFLAVDMVENADSGHPGAPMGQAAMAFVLWTRFLRHDPADPGWLNRDRFVLSCGHSSALLYGLLHLSDYALPLEELQRFRQLGSKTPGHPEHGLTPGVETTTGPLGQGLANAVGMAIAERMLAARFNRPDFGVVDYRTWVLASDGDLMEGVASEASSLAGHLRLGKLTVLYDSNGISIEGPTALTFSEDVGRRFEAYGWHVQQVDDGNDLEALHAALEQARDEVGRPSLIQVRTHIGDGSPNKQDTAGVHGAPLGAEELEATKRALGWPLEPAFYVPEAGQAPFRQAGERGRELHREWDHLLERYREAFPQAAAELRSRLDGQLPAGWQDRLPSFAPEDGPLATRSASGRVLNALAGPIPWLVGGSADLAPSNNTDLQGEDDFSADSPAGRILRFGVREHAMGGILNGLALSRMLIPYGGTFLVFSDYMRGAIRLAALMELPVTYVLTHDSIFLGEDGPTHQPISQLVSMRSIPGLTVIRPADACETVEAWRVALSRRQGPTALILSRQKLPVLELTRSGARQGLAKGAYVLADPIQEEPRLLLLATGSEVSLALGAQERLQRERIPCRLVSMPSWELFEEQTSEYRESVLPPHIRPRLAIEAAPPLGWDRYVGDAGEVVGLSRFGASAPHKDLAREFGFTVENIVERAKRLLRR